LALRPVTSHIPTISTTLEHTGAVPDNLPPPPNTAVEEGEITTAPGANDDNLPAVVPHDDDATDANLANLPALTPHDNVAHNIDAGCNPDDDDCPDLASRHDDDSVSEADTDASSTSEWDEDNDNVDDDAAIFDLVHPTPDPEEEEITPQPVNISRYGRIRHPNSRYAYNARSYEWENSVDEPRACAIEAAPSLLNSNDALSWEPAPATIRDIVRMPNRIVKEEWLKSVRKLGSKRGTVLSAPLSKSSPMAVRSTY